MQTDTAVTPSAPLQWLVNNLLGSQRAHKAAARLARRRCTGLRHFSANRKAVSLDEVDWMTQEIIRSECQIETELGFSPIPVRRSAVLPAPASEREAAALADCVPAQPVETPTVKGKKADKKRVSPGLQQRQVAPKSTVERYFDVVTASGADATTEELRRKLFGSYD